MKNYGFVPTDILLPENADMTKWSCVACDQYTSEPEYWNAVESTVGNAPSTLRLMLPEIYLSETEKRSEDIANTMVNYLENGVFNTIENSFIYVERTLANGKVRRGLIGAIDLEVYDFKKGTTSLCRPTEATVVERLPARVNVRKNALIEMPHIMMLLDDKNNSVIMPYSSIKNELELVYDFDLMQNSGHIAGYKVSGTYADSAIDALAKIYEEDSEEFPMLYAMGDGNHSLAAAKQYYEMLKAELGTKAENHPARYALVELVNLYDDSLEFEAIHRVIFDVDIDTFFDEFKKYNGLIKGQASGQQFTVVINGKAEKYTFTEPETSLTIGTLQNFIDRYLENHKGEVDYIHGEDVVCNLSSEKDRIGFIVDSIEKDSFFEAIKKDGILPRKTFSMGHACDKRFYLECRKIK